MNTPTALPREKQGFWETLKAGIPLHRPIIGWCSAFICGIAWGYTSAAILPFLVYATFCFGLQFCFRKRKVLADGCLLLAFSFLAAAWGGHSGIVHKETLTRLDAARGENVTLTLRIPENCRIIQPKNRAPYCIFTTETFSFSDGFESRGATLRVSHYNRKPHQDAPLPRHGEVWELEGRYTWRNHRYNFNSSVLTGRKIADANPWSPVYQLARLRERFARNLTFGLEETPERSLLIQTMTLGARQRMPYELRQCFADGGIIHIFAISGLHVGIIAGLLILILRYAHVLIRTRWAIVVPALVAYLVIAGTPPSAARACLMASIYFVAPLFLRKPDGPSALFITALIILLIEPAWVVSVSAQLSFSVIGGIILLMPPISYFLFKRARVLHNFEEHQTNIRLRGTTPWKVKFIRFLLSTLALTLSAWISSAPLSMYYFGRLSNAGLFLNLFVPTMAVVIVWVSCFSIAIGFFLPPLSALLNRFCATLLDGTIFVTERCTQIPGLVIPVSIHPALTLLLLAAILILGIWLRGLVPASRRNDPLNADYRGLGPINLEE